MGTLLAASTAYGTGRTAGLVATAVLILAVLRQVVWIRSNPKAGVRRALVLGGLAVMVVVNIGRIAGEAEPWESGRGAEMKAGFLDACQRSSGTVVDCYCAFQVVTTRPPYDTPDGFATLMGPASAAQRSGNPEDVPAVLVTALQSCPLGATARSAG